MKREKKDNSKKIMVVDDDLEISNLFKLPLQMKGYDVFGFTDPLLALEHFKINYNACNLVISDLRMPGMDGFETMRAIRQRREARHVREDRRDGREITAGHPPPVGGASGEPALRLSITWSAANAFRLTMARLTSRSAHSRCAASTT
jgi:CheY-like chemotaxis protein